jgi:hypothetical protein
MIQTLWNSKWRLCKVTRRRTDVREIVVIFPAWVKHHIFFKRPTPTVPTKPPFQRVLEALSLVVKWSARETDYSSHLEPRFKIYRLIPPFPILLQVEHRHNLNSTCNSMIKTRTDIIFVILFNLRPESKARNSERHVSYYTQYKQRPISHAVWMASSYMASRQRRFLMFKYFVDVPESTSGSWNEGQ